MKTIIAPGLKARLLGVNGWFSTNILGNRDGEVLDDPDAFKTKEESKLSVLSGILQPELYPICTGSSITRCGSTTTRPGGQQGIVGQHRHLRVAGISHADQDQLPLPRFHPGRPIVLDLALFMDLAQRAEMRGIQEWLSFYFKSPQHAAGLYPEHDLFIQLMKLKNTLRYLRGEELITHLGIEYYD